MQPFRNPFHHIPSSVWSLVLSAAKQDLIHMIQSASVVRMTERKMVECLTAEMSDLSPLSVHNTSIMIQKTTTSNRFMYYSIEGQLTSS